MLEVGIEATWLQLDQFLTVILCHLIILLIGLSRFLCAIDVLIGHCQRVGSDIQIVVGTFHGAFLGHTIAGTEEGQTGNKTNGEVTVHTFDTACADITPFHVGLNVYELLKNLAVDDVLIRTGLVDLVTPFGSYVIVRHITEEVTHQVVTVSLQTGGFAFDLLHLVGIGDAAGVDTCTYLVGTLDGLQVVIPDLLDVTPAYITWTLQGPYRLTVVGGNGFLYTHCLYVCILHPHTTHTGGVGVFTEQHIYAVDGVGRKLRGTVDQRLVHL